MKTVLVVYDSKFGNTEKIAQKIGSVLKKQKMISTVTVSHVDVVSRNQDSEYALIIIGSPTHGGQPTTAISTYISNTLLKFPNRVVTTSQKGGTKMSFAVFDTRAIIETLPTWLKMIVSLIGYAAPKMAAKIKKNGGQMIGETGFYVLDKEGPLKQGELTKAEKWAIRLTKKLK